jgi:hypothetical protein
MIFWYNSVLNVLLGVATRIGNRIFNRAVESIISFLRSSTSDPTIFSRSSLSSDAWWSVRIILRSSGNVFV